MTTTQFLVQKDNLHNTELRALPDAPLAPGHIRVAVDKFALTSNNITYAAFGDAMNYWQFFPVGEDKPGWGQIPVWGFGNVSQSDHPGVAVGERIYGYFPMASSLILQPAKISPAGFSDAAPHRSALHAVYNSYTRCNVDPFYTGQSEDVQALLRPLFTTAWLIDDFMADNAFFGAQQANGQPGLALLSSASSKTAYSTAFGLKARSGIEVIGLTSAGNVAFCESLGCYSRVVTYERLDQLPADQACVYIDFAGSAKLRLAVHTRFSNLKYSCSIGGTHVEDLGGASALPGPRATLFFAPAQIKKRSVDWGGAELGKRLVKAWFDFTQVASGNSNAWITVQHHHGAPAAAAAYHQVLAGRGDPRLGHMLHLP